MEIWDELRASHPRFEVVLATQFGPLHQPRAQELRRPNGHAVQINGLWGLRFGNGVTGDPKTLLFSAGIDDEAHGLFGTIAPTH